MPSEATSSHALTRRERWIWAQHVFVVLALMWFALRGFEAWLMGLLTALAGAWLSAAVTTIRPRSVVPWRVLPFTAFFLLASLRGGLDVAWRALHPSLPIEPQFRRFALDLPGGQPRTLMVSALSLMPGTLSAELDDGGATLVVHALSEVAMDSVEQLQARIRWLFAVKGSHLGEGLA